MKLNEKNTVLLFDRLFFKDAIESVRKHIESNGGMVSFCDESNKPKIEVSEEKKAELLSMLDKDYGIVPLK